MSRPLLAATAESAAGPAEAVSASLLTPTLSHASVAVATEVPVARPLTVSAVYAAVEDVVAPVLPVVAGPYAVLDGAAVPNTAATSLLPSDLVEVVPAALRPRRPRQEAA